VADFSSHRVGGRADPLAIEARGVGSFGAFPFFVREEAGLSFFGEGFVGFSVAVVVFAVANFRRGEDFAGTGAPRTGEAALSSWLAGGVAAEGTLGRGTS
jgi:hypothetical protein